MARVARKFTNNQLADIFDKIASLLEIKGEVIYKILAYRKAAESLRSQSQEAVELWKKGQLKEIPGVGKAIAEKIDELFTTGELGFLNKLTEEVPPSLVELLQVPDFGPKKAAMVWKQAGITNLEELEQAARAGKLHGLPGVGEKSEAKIIAGIEALHRRSDRIPLGRAYQFFDNLASYLRKTPGVKQVFPAGSMRRMRPTVGDLDLIVAVENSGAVMKSFVSHPQVARVIGSGETKSSVEFDNGMRAQLWVLPPKSFGTGWIYATGSKDHNVRLREMAQKKSWSINEHGLTQADGQVRYFSKEEDVYAVLGLPWIPPELREDRGEIKAALAGKLPKLIEVDDLKAELHAHTTWSDGTLSIQEMAEAAIQRGKKILAITDHSGSLGVAGGLNPEDLKRQREEIDQVQEKLGKRILLLQGSEVEIRSDGTLDFPDEVLASLDIVIASLHSSLRQPREKITARLIRAIRNPHVDIIGHPTGRMFPDREGADLDLEQVFREALDNKVALEINAHPARLDLDDLNARRAVELTIPLSINTDAHSASDMDLLHFGVGVARRGWVEAPDVINTWTEKKLLKWLGRKR